MNNHYFNLKRRRHLLQLGVAFSMVLTAPLVSVQASEQPLRILVGFSAGGATDSLIRVVAAEMSKELGKPVIVENKPGANQAIAIQSLRSAKPDGNTLFVGTGSSLAQSPAVQKNLPYDPKLDFTPVALLGPSPGAIYVRSSLPINSVKDLVDYARENPGKLNYGSAGYGSANHLSMEAFQLATGTKMTHIPLKSGTEIMMEIQAGRLDVDIGTMQVAQQGMPSGKLRMLAITSTEPLPFLPGVPTLQEVNVKGLEGLDPYTFFGLVGPKGLPDDIALKLNEVANRAISSPAVKQRMQEVLFVNPTPGTPEQFKQYLSSEYQKWFELGKHIKLEGS